MHPGISGISIYVPRHRVDLERWCEWTNAEWPKVSAVVGRSFRVVGPDENVYTMAANAVLRLIRQNRVDPRTIGLLALGTESSTDNAAGAVIVKGMVDEALLELGLPRIARDCEVPEFKHACLAGIYATKAACRYLATDGRERMAIVVSSDIAEYRRGSSGEQTQGAGAVAFLLEREPKLLALDLDYAGSASGYRGYDFRKPVRGSAANPIDQRPRDYPVFNGKYSTTCYVDAVLTALDSMFSKVDVDRRNFYADLAALFFHRPYQQLPIAAFATALVVDMARDPAGHGQLSELAALAGVSLDSVLAEVEARASQEFDLFAEAQSRGPNHDPLAAVGLVAKQLRASTWFRNLVDTKLSLGADLVRDVGNLYTASLPAWLAAGFEDAWANDIELADQRILLLGYGSGDAAEAIPATVVPGWQRAASVIGFARALEGSHALEREQYEALHDGRPVALPAQTAGFAIRSIGKQDDAGFQDVGVEYYRHQGS
jgi:hydroxymethylglutaryl-CoA synthase